MKTIGFADYYINEWHADHYPAWIDEACRDLSLDYRVAYCWAERDISPVNGRSTDEWCLKHGVTRCASLEELCRVSDVLLLLAPSDPEKHLPYAREALRHGKPTYIDKTFAPCLIDAERIFALGREYGTPFFSTSALRYASELKPLRGNMKDAVLTGGGGNFEEYLIHLVEMAVTLFPGVSFRRVQTEIDGASRTCRLESADGSRVTLAYAPDNPYTVTPKGADAVSVTSPFFLDLIRDILRFYETAKPPFPAGETLEVMRLRDGLLQSERQGGIPLNL